MTRHRLQFGPAIDAAFKGSEAFIDRNQFNNLRPGVHKVLERRSNLGEGIQNLVHRAERDFARNDSRCEHDVRKDIVSLQIQDAADVEVHIVEIDAEIVSADGCIELDQCGRRGAT